MVHICYYQLAFLATAMLLLSPVLNVITLTSQLTDRGLFSVACDGMENNGTHPLKEPHGRMNGASSDWFFVDDDAQQQQQSSALFLRDAEFADGNTQSLQTLLVMANHSSSGSSGSHSNIKSCRTRQSNAMAAACNAILAACQVAALPAGIAFDSLGGWGVAVASSLAWTLGTSISGFSPAGGVAFTIGTAIASVAGVFIFTPIMFHHIRHASVAKRYALWITALTALRNMAAIVNVPLAYLIEVKHLELYQVFLIYGLGVGVPITFGFATLFPKKLRINVHDCGSPEHLQLIAEQPELDTFSGIPHPEEEEEQQHQQQPEEEDDDNDDEDEEETDDDDRLTKKREQEIIINNSSSISMPLVSGETNKKNNSKSRPLQYGSCDDDTARNRDDMITGLNDEPVKNERTATTTAVRGERRNRIKKKQQQQKSQTAPISSFGRAKAALLLTLASVRSAFGHFLFWLCLARCVVLVTVSYFITANITTIAEVGFAADAGEAATLRTSLNYLMGGLSLFSIVPGKLSVALTPRVGLSIWCVVAALIAVCYTLLIYFGRHHQLGFSPSAFLAYGALVIWRVTGFANVNLSVPIVLQEVLSLSADKQKNKKSGGGGGGGGSLLGIMYTVAGILAMVFGALLTRAVQNADDADVLRQIILGCGAVVVVMELALAVALLCKTADANNDNSNNNNQRPTSSDSVDVDDDDDDDRRVILVNDEEVD